MTVEEQTRELSDEDGRLVDLVGAAMVDPNLHTDTRMRLHHEISEVVHAHEKVRGRTAAGTHAGPTPEHLAHTLRDVLVDPDLHDSLRMRLHREIPELLRSARADHSAQDR